MSRMDHYLLLSRQLLTYAKAHHGLTKDLYEMEPVKSKHGVAYFLLL